MKDPRKLVPVVIVILALLAAGAAVFLVLSPAPRGYSDTRPILRSLDSAIAAGALSTARDLLDGMTNLPSTEEDLLSLLKRAFEISSASGNYSTMSRLGGKALALAGGSARIRALAVLAYLRGGRLSEAEKAMAGGALPADTGDLLRGEAVLRRGGAWAASSPLYHDLLSLEHKKDPEQFAAAAVRTGDKRLWLDAALIAMESGGLGRAQRIVNTDLGEASFDEPASGLLYDGGDFETALERLKRLDAARPGRAGVGLMIADSYQALGRTEEAERSLRQALPLAPALTWTTYANLAFFAAARGDLGTAGSRLKDGLAFFPASRELLLAHARLEARQGNTASAESILSRLAADNPEDGESAMLLLELQAPGLSPEEYRARLWKDFNRVPADRAIFAALSSALIGSHDWEGASIAIQQHAEAGGPGGQELLLSEGMVAAMRGNDAAASDAFRRAAAIAGDGIARYDLALMLLHRGNGKAAVAELGIAGEEFERRGDPVKRAEVLSRMQMVIGSARLLDGDESGAREAFLRSRALNPQNLRAALLLRKLEAGRQQ